MNFLQDLLLTAHSKEAKKLEEEERIRRALDEKFPSEAPTEVCMSTSSLHFCGVYYLTGKIKFVQLYVRHLKICLGWSWPRKPIYFARILAFYEKNKNVPFFVLPILLRQSGYLEIQVYKYYSNKS